MTSLGVTHRRWSYRRRGRTPLETRLRRARLHEIRAYWGYLAAILSLLIAADVVLALLGSHSDLFIAGLLSGGLVVGMGWMLCLRTYPLTVGVWAERWSSALLRKPDGWQVVNGVQRYKHDIDHVVHTPVGVLAVETKYYGPSAFKAWPDSRLERDIATARRRAAEVASDARVTGSACVTPVLLLWGAGIDPDLETGPRQGVWVVVGSNPKTFLDRFTIGHPPEWPVEGMRPCPAGQDEADRRGCSQATCREMSDAITVTSRSSPAASRHR
jgi:hypothetical protein